MSDAMNLASRLNERITIEQASHTQDAAGGYTQNWSTHVTCYAEVKPHHTREQVVAAQREMQAMYRVTIRRRDSVTPAMRIQWNDITLNIHGVVHTDVLTEIIATEGGEA